MTCRACPYLVRCQLARQNGGCGFRLAEWALLVQERLRQMEAWR